MGNFRHKCLPLCLSSLLHLLRVEWCRATTCIASPFFMVGRSVIHPVASSPRSASILKSLKTGSIDFFWLFWTGLTSLLFVIDILDRLLSLLNFSFGFQSRFQANGHKTTEWECSVRMHMLYTGASHPECYSYTLPKTKLKDQHTHTPLDCVYDLGGVHIMMNN